jgi:glycosyltransferase involved in cell wall biosynthesis
LNDLPKKKIGYVLSYRAPRYVRTRTIVNALRKIKDVEVYEARNSTSGFLRYFQTLLRLIRIRIVHHPDIYILGFRGHEIFPFVRILTYPRALIFDAMMSPFGAMEEEGKLGKLGKLLSPVVYAFEKAILKLSDQILTDTALHRQFFIDVFDIFPEKIVPVYVGTDEDVFVPSKKSKNSLKEGLDVFFYSTRLPLHGVDFILEAARRLQKEPIRFTIVGGNQKHHPVSELSNLIQIDWVEFEKLPEYIEKADICLGGPFGNTKQAERVITGKTFQFLAMGKPVVIGRINEEVGFIDKRNCLFVEQGNPDSLTEVLLWALQNKHQLPAIGENGLELFRHHFSTPVIASQISEVLNQVIRV